MVQISVSGCQKWSRVVPNVTWLIKDIPIHVEGGGGGGVAIILGSEAMTGAALALRRTMRGADRHGAEGPCSAGVQTQFLVLCSYGRTTALRMN